MMDTKRMLAEIDAAGTTALAEADEVVAAVLTQAEKEPTPGNVSKAKDSVRELVARTDFLARYAPVIKKASGRTVEDACYGVLSALVKQQQQRDPSLAFDAALQRVMSSGVRPGMAKDARRLWDLYVGPLRSEPVSALRHETLRLEKAAEEAVTRLKAVR